MRVDVAFCFLIDGDVLVSKYYLKILKKGGEKICGF
jgi:hypothetical protein